MKRALATRLFVAAISTAVATALVAAVVVLGPPVQQRQRHMDERRVRDLMSISSAIALYAGMHDALPPDLSALGKEPGPRRAPTDPETGVPYEYHSLGADNYQLCAVFATASSDADGRLGVRNDEWVHDTGRQCFERKQKITRN